MANQKNPLNRTEFGKEIVKMPQWAKLRQELSEMGKVYDATFTNADMAEMHKWGQNQSDLRQYVWNAVVVSLVTGRALNASVVQPILELFPSAQISNCK